jgi:hypothetical protein
MFIYGKQFYIFYINNFLSAAFVEKKATKKRRRRSGREHNKRNLSLSRENRNGKHTLEELLGSCERLIDGPECGSASRTGYRNVSLDESAAEPSQSKYFPSLDAVDLM